DEALGAAQADQLGHALEFALFLAQHAGQQGRFNAVHRQLRKPPAHGVHVQRRFGVAQRRDPGEAAGFELLPQRVGAQRGEGEQPVKLGIDRGQGRVHLRGDRRQWPRAGGGGGLAHRPTSKYGRTAATAACSPSRSAYSAATSASPVHSSMKVFLYSGEIVHTRGPHCAYTHSGKWPPVGKRTFSRTSGSRPATGCARSTSPNRRTTPAQRSGSAVVTPSSMSGLPLGSAGLAPGPSRRWL